MTKSGDIVSGKRLEQFLSDLGRHEDPYYDNKKKEIIEVEDCFVVDQHGCLRCTVCNEEVRSNKNLVGRKMKHLVDKSHKKNAKKLKATSGADGASACTSGGGGSWLEKLKIQYIFMILMVIH